MAYFDKSILMMDAGMAMVKSEDGFGEVLGQARVELKSFGKVLKISDNGGGRFLDAVAPDDLPVGISDFDILVDRSTFFRRRYIALQVQMASPGEYAIMIKEGNKNTPARDFVTLAIAGVGFLRLVLVPGVVSKIIGLALLVLGLWLNAISSRNNISTSQTILNVLEKMDPHRPV